MCSAVFLHLSYTLYYFFPFFGAYIYPLLFHFLHYIVLIRYCQSFRDRFFRTAFFLLDSYFIIITLLFLDFVVINKAGFLLGFSLVSERRFLQKTAFVAKTFTCFDFLTALQQFHSLSVSFLRLILRRAVRLSLLHWTHLLLIF